MVDRRGWCRFSSRCPAEFPFGGGIITQNWVETFNDGSLLTGATDSGLVCTDGVAFVAEADGTITGGTGRFAGASGTWHASVVTVNGGLTGTLTADLN